MPNRRTLYHDHQVEMLRRKVGRRRADALLTDAVHGRVHAVALGMAFNGQVRYRQDGDDEVAYVSSHEAPLWRGAELQLEQRLPDTLQAAIIGRRLGDVVSGSGADDHVITGVGDRSEGTRIVVATTLVAADDIGLPLATRIAGPARRAMRRLARLIEDMARDLRRARGLEPHD